MTLRRGGSRNFFLFLLITEQDRSGNSGQGISRFVFGQFCLMLLPTYKEKTYSQCLALRYLQLLTYLHYAIITYHGLKPFYTLLKGTLSRCSAHANLTGFVHQKTMQLSLCRVMPTRQSDRDALFISHSKTH